MTVRISVVIPAYHSDATIAATLEGLERQSLRDFEVVVVNSSDEPRTERIVADRFHSVRFEQHPTRLRPHAARNRGVELARGGLLVFTDPDCVPRFDWLERLEATAAQHDLVVGAMGLRVAGWTEWAVHLVKYHALLPGLPPRTVWIAPTANACISRRLFERIGPFDGDLFCGDALLSWRATAAGSPPYLEPGAVVDHIHGLTPSALWRVRLSRGLEFGRVRACAERWTSTTAATRLAALPVLPLVVLLRAVRDAAAAGWLRRSLATLPLQLLGHLAWSLGEARSQLEILRDRVRR